jgi:hypothetical protein
VEDQGNEYRGRDPAAPRPFLYIEMQLV